MKIKIELEVSPHEAREFFGLPNVQPLQDEMMERIGQNMREGVSGYDPMSLMKPFLPSNLQSMEAFQKAFLESFAPRERKKKG